MKHFSTRHVLLLFTVTVLLTRQCVSQMHHMDFAPLHCNMDASIDSDDCLSDAVDLSTILSEDESGTLTIPCGRCVVVDYTDGSNITVPGGLNVVGRLHFPSSANVVLRTTSVFVQGLWSMEKPDDGNSVTLSLYGGGEKTLYPHNDCCQNADDFYGYDCSCAMNPQGLGRKPFAVVGGQLDIRVVDENCESWSVLKDVDIDTMKSFTVDTSFANCLRPGDDLLVTSDSSSYKEHSLFTVESVDKTTGDVVLRETMSRVFPSEAGAARPELAVEVALLRRDVVFSTEEDPEESWIGGHSIIFHTPTVLQTIQGVKFDNFGQEGVLGRYPIHFHKSGNTASLVSKNVIMNSNQRCIFIHDTNLVTVDDNVAFDTRGHCIATETGSEVGNVFSHNLGAYTKDLRRSNGQSDSPGDTQNGASTFWFRNMNNTFVDNVAAGCKMRGYWIELDDKYQNQVHPESFMGNSAHSNDHGLITYKRGWLPSEPAVVQDFVSFNNREGAKFHITGNLTFKNALFADNVIGVRYGAWNQGVAFEDTLFMLSKQKNGAYVAEITMNNKAWFHKNIVFRNVIFRNYGEKTGTMKFSDHKLMEEDMGDPVHAYNVTFENCDENAKPKLSECGYRYRNWFLEDYDGTLGPAGTDPGFYIRDHELTKVFLPEDSCAATPNGEEGCAAFCEGVCVRLVRLTPTGRLTMENTDYEELQLTNAATGKSYVYPLNEDGQFMVVLPAGQYEGEFLDQDGESLAVDTVDVEVFAEPRCTNFVTEDDFVFLNTVPPTDAPTTSPSAEPTIYYEKTYDLVGQNLYCSSTSTFRLFKNTDTNSVEECHERCFHMPGCNFFAYLDWKTMCMGCSLEDSSHLEDHGFSFQAYEMTSFKDFGYELLDDFDGLNTRCLSNGEWLGEFTTSTRRECYQRCRDTPDCGWFSWGEDQASWTERGDCILCQSDGGLESYEDFNTYEMMSAPFGIPSSSPSDVPSLSPSERTEPSDAPSFFPSELPSSSLSDVPSDVPTNVPTNKPTVRKCTATEKKRKKFVTRDTGERYTCEYVKAIRPRRRRKEFCKKAVKGGDGKRRVRTVCPKTCGKVGQGECSFLDPKKR